MNCKMKFRITVIACGAALLIAEAIAVVVASRNRRQPAPPPDVPVAAPPAEVRAKAVERKPEPSDHEVIEASAAVAIVCGADSETADRYEARNDALRLIARRRDLPKGDVDALLVYLRRADDAMRIERVAALKNDVMNLLRNQESPVEGLAETLIAMIEGNNGDCGGAQGTARPSPVAPGRGRPCYIGGGATTNNSPTPNSPIPNSPTHPHPPVVVDYCIQHLGAMLNELDDAVRKAVRGVLVKAARERTKTYAGTALFSLAEDKRATPVQEGGLKRLTLALCKPGVNDVARIAAIQLAGQRGYAEALPIWRDTLSGEKRDAVLDTVCIGSIGLLGTAHDIALIERFRGAARRSAAVDAAIKRIKGREDIGTPTAGKGASLTLRTLLRAVQPHEIRSDSFGGLGAVPPDKENIVGGNNRGFATRS